MITYKTFLKDFIICGMYHINAGRWLLSGVGMSTVSVKVSMNKVNVREILHYVASVRIRVLLHNVARDPIMAVAINIHKQLSFPTGCE